MSNNKQSSVEWLEQNLPDLGEYIPLGVSIELHAKFEQAKEMRDKEIQDAWKSCIEEHKRIENTAIKTTMKLSNEFNPIRDWATEKGIIQKADMKSQFLKLVEEVGELSNGMQKRNDDEIKDAIGDCVVVLTNLAAIHGGFTIEECVNSAYEVISKRKGKMVDGVFVKEGAC